MPQLAARRRAGHAWLRPIALAAILALGALAPAAAAETESVRKVDVSGVERSYLLHLPRGAPDGKPLPLVVVLHGGGGSGALVAAQTGFSAEADQEGFIVAYPDGSDRPRPLMSALGKPGLLTWNAGGCCGYAQQQDVDDVAFFRALVADVERSHPIDRKRIYVAGHSNGGMMAYRIACEASGTVAAIGVVSGVMVSAPCAPSGLVSVIDIHGTADANVPIGGGVGSKSIARVSYPPVAQTIAFWAANDDCSPVPTSSRPLPGVSLDDYESCPSGLGIAYYRIEGGGHAWPGGKRVSMMLDKPSEVLQATPLIWAFFKAHPKS
ncbi:MAG TPA: PHB depolymerase family esterase [Dongiaceae bacterium]|nr:PHB depolymerase family esterase [Dongiaceae bacterium]